MRNKTDIADQATALYQHRGAQVRVGQEVLEVVFERMSFHAAISLSPTTRPCVRLATTVKS
jgi:hypothetical protein